MKRIVFILLVFALSSCHVSSPLATEKLNKVDVYDAAPGSGAPAAPGKCYTKMKSPDGEIRWTEVICGNNKSLIMELATRLKALDFSISEQALNGSMDDSLKAAITSFQEQQGLAVGGITEVLLYRLRMETPEVE